MGSLPNLSILKGPTRSYSPNYLHNIFENLATTTAADSVALIFDENGEARQYTYQELNDVTNKIARTILEIKNINNLTSNSDGDYVVAVSMQPSDKLVIALLSIWKAGAAYLPLDEAFPEPRVEHILTESKPMMVIFDQDFGFFKNTFKISYDDLLEKSKMYTIDSLKDNLLTRAKDDLAIVLYTSGSTGIPKGVRILHKVILNRLNWQFKAFPYGESEKKGVFKTALTFVDSVSEIWGPLISGLSVVVVPKNYTKDPEKFINFLEKYKIERIVLVPSLLRSILMYLEIQKNRPALPYLKTWVCSGETLTVSLAEEFFKCFTDGNHKLCNFYGSTEVMGDVTFYSISDPRQLKLQDKIPIGLPVDNTIVYLLDNEYRPVKVGDVGELFVSGLNLAAGYVNKRDPEKFINNPLAIDPVFSKLYRTGDFARIEKGCLIYEGRTDSQVKIRGHRVDLTEIEKALMSLDTVEKAVVLCYKPGEMNQALLAFVVCKDSFASESQIESILREKLTSYMVPQVILLDSIPYLINGKVDRQTLLKNYENTSNGDSFPQVEIDYTGVTPSQKEAATVLFETVASVLNQTARAAVSINSNFYEIGGNSLNSVYTISRLNQQGYHISIGDFIGAMDFGEILERMLLENKEISFKAKPPCFTTEPMKREHKKIVQDMITTSFYHKAELERYIIDRISEVDYAILIDAFFEPLIQKDLSFLAKNETGKVVGVAINLDAWDEPEVEIDSALSIIWEFLDYVEIPTKNSKLPKGKGKVLHSVMMATHCSLSTKENVAVMKFLEDEVMNLAKSRGFEGIFTTNTSPLTQQLASDVYQYETLLDYRIKNYVASDKTKPFGLADESERALVQWKRIK